MEIDSHVTIIKGWWSNYGPGTVLSTSCALFHFILPKRNVYHVHATSEREGPELANAVLGAVLSASPGSPWATRTTLPWGNAIITPVLQVQKCGTKALNRLQPRVE